MSRHNRRRTRGGHKLSATALHSSTDSPVSESSDPSSDPSPFSGPKPNFASRNQISARHWHNRYTAWQARERRQREESENLEAAKKRIFGEDDGSGEDDSLCVKMLEYFDGLDYLHG